MQTIREAPRDIRAKIAGLAALVVAASLLCCVRALAITLVRAEIGQWDLLQDGANRTCRLILHAGPVTASRRSVGMPAGCSRSLNPRPRRSWTLSATIISEFADDRRSGARFTGQTGGYFVTSNPEGETYQRFVERVPHRTRLARAARSRAKKRAKQQARKQAKRQASSRSRLRRRVTLRAARFVRPMRPAVTQSYAKAARIRAAF
jgi:hypothetical protein